MQTAPVQKEKLEVKAKDGEDEIVMSDGEGNEGYVTESGQDQQLAKNMRRIMKIQSPRETLTERRKTNRISLSSL